MRLDKAYDNDGGDSDFQSMLNAVIESKVTNKVVEEMKNFKEQIKDDIQTKLSKAELQS